MMIPTEARAVEIHDLTFSYPNAHRPALDSVSLLLNGPARCLLLGPNGSGKSTLLAILAGRYLVPEERVRVFGRPAFHDTTLVRDVSHIGGQFQFDVDIAVRTILAGKRAPRDRVDGLCAILEIDPEWHMHRISDGQRRRVQILLGLLAPKPLLLLDEVTADLDLRARADLLDFIRAESDTGGKTVLHATHILDGLEEWATHVAYLDAGRLIRYATIDAVSPPDQAGQRPRLYPIVRRWMARPFR